METPLTLKQQVELLMQQRRDAPPKKEAPQYPYPPIEPIQCKTCKKYRSQFETKNIFGGYCFSCDVDVYYAKNGKK